MWGKTVLMPESDPAEGTVVCEVDGPTARLTLSRPEKLNALSNGMRRSFDIGVRRILADEAIRIVLICGEGRAFCAGGDLDNLPQDPMAWRQRIRLAQAHHWGLIASDKIVVAAVQGVAVGGGASLALSADILVLAEDARLVFPFVKLGLVPDGGAAYLLASKIGPALATDILLTGGVLTAAEARAAGLSRRVVARDALGAAVDNLLEELLSLPSEGAALTKNLLRGVWARNLQTGLDHEADVMGLASVTPSHKAALERALAKLGAKQP